MTPSVVRGSADRFFGVLDGVGSIPTESTEKGLGIADFGLSDSCCRDEEDGEGGGERVWLEVRDRVGLGAFVGVEARSKRCLVALLLCC